MNTNSKPIIRILIWSLGATPNYFNEQETKAIARLWLGTQKFSLCPFFRSQQVLGYLFDYRS